MADEIGFPNRDQALPPKPAAFALPPPIPELGKKKRIACTFSFLSSYSSLSQQSYLNRKGAKVLGRNGGVYSHWVGGGFCLHHP